MAIVTLAALEGAKFTDQFFCDSSVSAGQISRAPSEQSGPYILEISSPGVLYQLFTGENSPLADQNHWSVSTLTYVYVYLPIRLLN
jgi:hypothetical protein